MHIHAPAHTWSHTHSRVTSQRFNADLISIMRTVDERQSYLQRLYFSLHDRSTAMYQNQKLQKQRHKEERTCNPTKKFMFSNTAIRTIKVGMGVVSRVFVAQVWRPEFRSPGPAGHPGQPIYSSWFSERSCLKMWWRVVRKQCLQWPLAHTHMPHTHTHKTQTHRHTHTHT